MYRYRIYKYTHATQKADVSTVFVYYIFSVYIGRNILRVYRVNIIITYYVLGIYLYINTKVAFGKKNITKQITKSRCQNERFRRAIRAAY